MSYICTIAGWLLIAHAMDPRLHGKSQHRVIGGMEFDLINSLSERVMSVQNRNVLLANRPPLSDFFAPNSLTEVFQQRNISPSSRLTASESTGSVEKIL